jgi:hypothetical protein
MIDGDLLIYLAIGVASLGTFARRLWLLVRDGVQDVATAELVESMWKWDGFLIVGGTAMFAYLLSDFGHWRWEDWANTALLVAIMLMCLLCHFIGQYHLARFKR